VSGRSVEPNLVIVESVVSQAKRAPACLTDGDSLRDADHLRLQDEQVCHTAHRDLMPLAVRHEHIDVQAEHGSTVSVIEFSRSPHMLEYSQ
jgi:hypothetical protein